MNSLQQDKDSPRANGHHGDRGGVHSPARHAYFWQKLFPASALMLLMCTAGRLFWEPLCFAWGTYPSDVWYIYHNYGHFLLRHTYFSIEYPAPMLILFKVLSKIAALFPGEAQDQYGGTIYPCVNWIAVNSVFLGLCALLSVWLAYRLCVRYFNLPPSRVLWGFVLSPCFLFFCVYNYDMVALLCSLAALWLYLEDDDVGACACCGLGFAFKVYPGLMFPLFWLCLPWGRRWKALGAFLLPWLILNVPMMASDFSCWLYPYTWQLNFDNTEIQTGRLGYTLYGLIGKGPALALMTATMALVLWQVWKRRPTDFRTNALWLARSSTILFACFILLKNVFSPQYLLWLTPFLGLGGGYPFWGLYSLVELISGLEVTFLFKLKEHLPQFIVCARALRDLAVVWALGYTARQLCRGYGDKEKESNYSNSPALKQCSTGASSAPQPLSPDTSPVAPATSPGSQTAPGEPRN